MGQQKNGQDEQRTSTARRWIDRTPVATIVALVLSLLSFYRSYIYINQRLEVTVTEVSDGTNRGELYMTIAFSNGGNRDAAVLRVEPALWTPSQVGARMGALDRKVARTFRSSRRGHRSSSSRGEWKCSPCRRS